MKTAPQILPFDQQPRTRIVFGIGTVDRVGELALQLPAKRVLLVTDAGLVAAGHVARVLGLLEAAGLEAVCFDSVEENPSTNCVRQCVEVARRAQIDALIALGGGSSMDTAKGCNFILTNGGEMRDYWGVGKAKKPMLPLIAIPTTGGTGSECQSYALITDEQTHQKMACGDPKAAARIALLDPALSLSQPATVTACTGVDAIAHAVESAVTTKRTPVSSLYAREAFRLTVHAFPRVLSHPQDLDARATMLLGAAWAGLAIENSMLGAAHSAANPLTAHLGVVHGSAVGIMLPHVVRLNSSDPDAAAIYADLAKVAQISPSTASALDAAGDLAGKLEELLDLADIRRFVPSRNGHRELLPQLAKEAASQWTARFNPVPVSPAHFEQLYEQALARA